MIRIRERGRYLSYSNIYNDAARGIVSDLTLDGHDIYSQSTAFDLNPTSLGLLNQEGRNTATEGGPHSEKKKKEKEVAAELTQATTLNLLNQIRDIDAQIAELQERLEDIGNEIASIEVRREEIAQERQEIAEQRQSINQNIYEIETELTETDFAIEEIDLEYKAQEEIFEEKKENIAKEDMASGNGQALQETRTDLRPAIQAGTSIASQLASVEDPTNKAVFRDAEGNFVLYDLETDQVLRPLNESDTQMLQGYEKSGHIDTIANLEDVRSYKKFLGKDKFFQEISLNEDYIALQKLSGQKDQLEEQHKELSEKLKDLQTQLQDLDEREETFEQEDEQLEHKLSELDAERTGIEQHIKELNDDKEKLLQQQADLDKQFESDWNTYNKERSGLSYAGEGSDANGQTSQRFNEAAYRPSLNTIGTIQANLQKLGYYERNDINQSDGIWGSQTNDAFADFLKDIQSEPGSTYQGKVDGLYGPLTRAALVDKIEALEATGPEKAADYKEVLQSLDSMYPGQINNLYSRPADWNQDELEKQANLQKLEI